MKPIFVAIAGGTGAGKSTLCTALIKKYPDKIGLVQLDDYFKPKAEAPLMDEIVNLDHPESLYLDKLARDLSELAKDHSVVINTKNDQLNPGYENTKQRIPIRFHPKPIILVEGVFSAF